MKDEGLMETKEETSNERKDYNKSFIFYLYILCVRKCVCTKGVKRVVCVGLHVPQDVDASICFSPKIISLILLI